MLFQLLFDTDVPTQPASSGGVGFAVVALLLIVLLLIGVAVTLIRRLRSSASSDWDHAQRVKMTNAWREVESLAKTGGAGRKLSVIEADKLVDTALRHIGFPGETMAERMKVAEYRFPSIRQMWLAHKWRNQLVHEAHFSLSERQTAEALRAYEAVLKDMCVLL